MTYISHHIFLSLGKVKRNLKASLINLQNYVTPVQRNHVLVMQNIQESFKDFYLLLCIYLILIIMFSIMHEMSVFPTI